MQALCVIGLQRGVHLRIVRVPAGGYDDALGSVDAQVVAVGSARVGSHHLVAFFDEAFQARLVPERGVGLSREIPLHACVGDAFSAGFVFAALAVVEHGAVSGGPACVAGFLAGHAPLKIDFALIHAVDQIAIPIDGLCGVIRPEAVEVDGGVVERIVGEVVADFHGIDHDAGFLLLPGSHGAYGGAAQAGALVEFLDQQGFGAFHGGEVRRH